MNEMHDYIDQLQKKHSHYTIKEYSGIVQIKSGYVILSFNKVTGTMIRTDFHELQDYYREKGIQFSVKPSLDGYNVEVITVMNKDTYLVHVFTQTLVIQKIYTMPNNGSLVANLFQKAEKPVFDFSGVALPS